MSRCTNNTCWLQITSTYIDRSVTLSEEQRIIVLLRSSYSYKFNFVSSLAIDSFCRTPSIAMVAHPSNQWKRFWSPFVPLSDSHFPLDREGVSSHAKTSFFSSSGQVTISWWSQRIVLFYCLSELSHFFFHGVIRTLADTIRSSSVFFPFVFFFSKSTHFDPNYHI